MMRNKNSFGVLVAATVLWGAWSASPSIDAIAAEPRESAEESKYPPGYIQEGPLPEGFPPPSEVGQIVEKSYPCCRTYWARGNNAFMRCFAYLSKRQHKMTAPVIMDYQQQNNDTVAAQLGEVNFMDVARMHFILEKPSLDEPKEDGPVTVADMPRMRVLSIAFQADMSADRLDEAERKLEAELARRGDIVATGPKRVLGYNSPMVPQGKAYWEIQVPIADRPATTTK